MVSSKRCYRDERLPFSVFLGGCGQGYFLAVARDFRDPASPFCLLAKYGCGFRYPHARRAGVSLISTQEKRPLGLRLEALFSTGGDGG